MFVCENERRKNSAPNYKITFVRLKLNCLIIFSSPRAVPFSLFNFILLMLVYLVCPGCVRHRVKMEEHKFKSQTFWIKSALNDHQRAPEIVQIIHCIFSLFFSINVHSYYCVLFVAHSGVVEWNVRVSNFSLRSEFHAVCNFRHKVSHALRLLSLME